MEAPVQAALVAAGTSLLVLAIEKAWIARREHRRQTQIRYLYPLKMACDDLLAYWTDIIGRLRAGKRDVGAPFERAKRLCESGSPDFYAMCNGEMCGPVGTMYTTACYFACATRLREQLPLVRISQRTALRLLEATEAVRAGIGSGGPYGFWTEIQDSIGRLVSTDGDHVLPYAAFCRKLSEDFRSYIRLFDFYKDIAQKQDDQLKLGYAALVDLDELLSHVLRTPLRRGNRAPPAEPHTILEHVSRAPGA